MKEIRNLKKCEVCGKPTNRYKETWYGNYYLCRSCQRGGE